jgi:hypothetical protein
MSIFLSPQHEINFRLDCRDSVEAGAELLDEIMPDWFTRINPEILDIESPHSCVCGQVFQSMWQDNKAASYSPFHMAVELYDINPVECGFDADDDLLCPENEEDYLFAVDVEFKEINAYAYSTLAEFWIDEVKHRFELGV